MAQYIQHLDKMLRFGSGPWKPSTFEPIAHYALAVLGGAWLRYLHHEVTTFLE